MGRFPLSCLLSPGDVRRGPRKPAHQHLPSLPFRLARHHLRWHVPAPTFTQVLPRLLARQNLRKSLPILGVETMRLLVPLETLHPLSHPSQTKAHLTSGGSQLMYFSCTLVYSLFISSIKPVISLSHPDTKDLQLQIQYTITFSTNQQL